MPTSRRRASTITAGPGRRTAQPSRSPIEMSAAPNVVKSPPPMRFSKADVLDVFGRQDAAYRLAILASHWLRGATNYKPSAADEARNLAMEAAGKWIPFSDLADELERDPGPLAYDFVLNQLHASVRMPLEVLTAYCHDYDHRSGRSVLVPQLEAAEWYVYPRAVRNALSHDLRFRFSSKFKELLPTTWHGITISAEMEGQPVSWETFGNGPGYELLLAMQEFASRLPDDAVDEAPHPRVDRQRF